MNRYKWASKELLTKYICILPNLIEPPANKVDFYWFMHSWFSINYYLEQ